MRPEPRRRRRRLVGLGGVEIGDLREALAAAVLFVGAEDPAGREIERESFLLDVLFFCLVRRQKNATRPPKGRRQKKRKTLLLTTRCTVDGPCRPGSSRPPWRPAGEASSRPLHQRLASRQSEA